jgi:hypothetical protein
MRPTIGNVTKNGTSLVACYGAHEMNDIISESEGDKSGVCDHSNRDQWIQSGGSGYLNEKYLGLPQMAAVGPRNSGFSLFFILYIGFQKSDPEVRFQLRTGREDQFRKFSETSMIGKGMILIGRIRENESSVLEELTAMSS